MAQETNIVRVLSFGDDTVIVSDNAEILLYLVSLLAELLSMLSLQM